ncbi:hypothetical protein SELMODRAFT_112012 [Selaginella moellendorffii]|uniref:Uncharacterized protein n=1 Tax=Selaginella moellendorffii TaxID=88036 RepID=D8S999_SELML|nr:hypothetical protein SELMODRAFT_112012 [Selaginella moellendorffii]
MLIAGAYNPAEKKITVSFLSLSLSCNVIYLLEFSRIVFIISLSIDIDLNFVFQVHKLVDLSSSPNAESFWSFEVIEAYHMFYKSQMDEPT